MRYLIKEFFALVLTGYLIAVPIAFYSMDNDFKIIPIE